MTRITQGHVSQSVSDFPFLETLGIREYDDPDSPAIFIGCYDADDLELIKNHRSKKVIHWMGQDALDAIFLGHYLDLKDVEQVAFHPNILKVVSQFMHVRQIYPWTVGSWTLTPLGDKVCVYMPPSHLAYHKFEIIEKLQKDLPGITFAISDGSVPQRDWLAGLGDKFYDESFLGLVLNGFAGGANTIMQLLLKGRPVVTNVLRLQGCIAWSNYEDLKYIVKRNYMGRGASQILTHEPINLDTSYDFLNLEFYERN